MESATHYARPASPETTAPWSSLCRVATLRACVTVDGSVRARERIHVLFDRNRRGRIWAQPWTAGDLGHGLGGARRPARRPTLRATRRRGDRQRRAGRPGPGAPRGHGRLEGPLSIGQGAAPPGARPMGGLGGVGPCAAELARSVGPAGAHVGRRPAVRALARRLRAAAAHGPRSGGVGSAGGGPARRT